MVIPVCMAVMVKWVEARCSFTGRAWQCERETNLHVACMGVCMCVPDVQAGTACMLSCLRVPICTYGSKSVFTADVVQLLC